MEKRGRPTRLTEAVEARIIDGVRQGKVMGEVCAAEGMPCRELVQAWMAERPDFRAKVQRARELGADALAERALEIADEVPPVSGDVAKARLRADVRLKLAAAWNAAYSNRPNVQITHEHKEINFGMSGEQMARLANLIRPLIEGQVIDVTPRKLAPSLRGSNTPPMRRS